MSKIESYAPGSFCWADLATTDVPSAKSFYSEMFGWTPVDFPNPSGTYTIFRSGDNDVAALYPSQAGMPPHWGVYFSVTTLDDSAARIAPLGGTIVMGPVEVGDSGRMVVAQDPQGVFFSLWQARQHIGATHPGPLNRVSWPELTTPEPASAAAFYTSLLGWTTKPESGFDTAMYIEWVNQGASIGGMMPMRGDEWKGVPPHWMIYITVADCDERAAKAAELGARICVPPHDIPNVGRFSVMGDPQGAMFSIIQMTAVHTPAGA
jgi:predicted enzyme related to lactoylglutathione lyase